MWIWRERERIKVRAIWKKLDEMRDERNRKIDEHRETENDDRM